MSGNLYGDMLGVPFKKGGRSIAGGLDCAGVCKLYMERLGIETPESAWRIQLDFTGAPVVEDCWELLGRGYTDATQAGDVIVSAPVSSSGSSDHVSVVVNPTLFSALSTVDRPDVGCYLSKTYAILNVIGAYRYRPC